MITGETTDELLSKLTTNIQLQEAAHSFVFGKISGHLIGVIGGDSGGISVSMCDTQKASARNGNRQNLYFEKFKFSTGFMKYEIDSIVHFRNLSLLAYGRINLLHKLTNT